MFKVILFSIGMIIGASILNQNMNLANFNRTKTKVESNKAVMDLQLPSTEVLTRSKKGVKLKSANKTITLEGYNTLILRGPVTSKSVAKVQAQLNKMSLRLGKKETIYLVLDTPGGSISAGMDLIDHMTAIPQKVETITLFAASMGFKIVQSMGKRMITPTGTLMSHRASLGGLSGQIYGEFETRFNMIKRKVDYLNAISAKRMGISVEKYQDLVREEYWVHGFDSVDEKAADEIVNVTCGESLDGNIGVVINTIFGPVDVVFSKCPLVRGPLAISFRRIAMPHRAKVKNAVEKSLNQKHKYVKEFILTDEHYKYFD